MPGDGHLRGGQHGAADQQDNGHRAEDAVLLRAEDAGDDQHLQHRDDLGDGQTDADDGRSLDRDALGGDGFPLARRTHRRWGSLGHGYILAHAPGGLRQGRPSDECWRGPTCRGSAPARTTCGPGLSDPAGIVRAMPGAFVVFEGGEGAGKSTQSRLLADALRARGVEVVVTREPGGTPIGEAIRVVLLGAGSDGMSARTEALLFAAARAEHAAALIRPAVTRGAVVISDRYLDSSVAYQGAARRLGEDRIAELSLWATEGLVPDLTVLLDVAPGVGLGRAGDANRMEAEPEAFHDDVRAAFLRRAAAAPDRYLVLAAARPKDEVASAVLAAVLERLGGSSPRVSLRPDRVPGGRGGSVMMRRMCSAGSVAWGELR